ncbi:MAG: M23 family metallopeptidase [Elusimicrobia bacterium]|nr:M23 family metallopeptidase [Elusimicrobiota bacterium]
MNRLGGVQSRLSEFLGRKITVMVIPHAAWKPWRWQVSVAFALFCFALWVGATFWAGFICSRHVDYWITKADNRVMLAKLSSVAAEMDKAREILDVAKSTDRQLRVLLSLSRREDAFPGEAAVGGPTGADRLTLQRLLAIDPSLMRQSDWHRRLKGLREESNKRLASFQEIAWYIGNQRSLLQATPSIWPTSGQLTSLFGYRISPMQRFEGDVGEYHQGVDIADKPDTLIYATANGTVRFAGWSHGYGQMIVIDHGYGISTLYAHTSKSLVKTGARVARGQAIGYMGTTGRSTGAHLHYEIWRQGRPVNPMGFLKVRSAGDPLGWAQPAVRIAGR